MLEGHSTTIAPEFEGRACLGCRLLVARPPVRYDPDSFRTKVPAPKPMVRLIRPSKDLAQERDERVWEFLPSAVWDLNFRGPLEWIEEQGCRDADAFKQLVRNNPDALGECLERIRIHRVSAGAVSLVGASSEEECIRRSRELLTAESKADFLRILMAAFRNEHDVHLETAIMTCSREPRDVRAHWRFVEDENGHFGRALVSVTDMTAEHELEQRLVLAERMSAIGTLTASIIHEVKNPLTFVWNHLRSLRDLAEPVSPEASELIREAYEGSERIRIIANEITYLSHSGEGVETETVKLQQVLDSAIRMAQPEIQHRATVVREYEAGSLYIRGPRTRLGQLFLNLIVNAAQAIDPGSEHRRRSRLRGGAGHGPRDSFTIAAEDLRSFRDDEARGTRNRSRPLDLSPHRAFSRRDDRDSKSPRPRHRRSCRLAQGAACATPAFDAADIDERGPARHAGKAFAPGRRRRAGDRPADPEGTGQTRCDDRQRRPRGGRLDGAARLRRNSL